MAITRIKNNQITDSTITNVKIVSGTLTGDKMNPNLTFNSNLVLNGNLTVTGNVTAVQSTTTQISDPLLTLGLGNAGTSYDLGLILTRGSGGNRFLGWKENQGAFVFINTTEDGLTTGNIATTAYGNLLFGNATALGATTLGGFTLNGNTLNSAGAMTIRSDAGTITVANALVGTGAVSLGSTLSVFSTATVNALTSNGAIQGTTLSGSGNVTANALTVNNSATIGGTLGVVGNINGSGITLTGTLRATGAGDFDGGLQSTPIGNVTPSTALFTTVGASGNTTVSALTVNNSATIGSTLGVTGALTGAAAQFTTINGSGAATVSSLGVNGAALIGTTLGVNGATTVSSLTVNNAITAATATILGNLLVEGNLRVMGNLSYINVDEFVVEDPIIQLNTGPNGAPLSVDNGFDSGVRTHYFDTAYRSAFFGYKDSTGFFEYYSNVTGESGNVITGTLGTIRTGNLQLTGSASIGTSLAVGSNATVNALTVNASATIGTTLSVTGNAITGNLSTTNINATNGIFTNNVTVAGTLTATSNVVANASGIFFGNAITGNSAIFAGVPGFTTLGTNVVAQFAGNVNSYSQINFENINSGSQASTDLVLTADNGNDSTNFVNMGIASSAYNYPALFPGYGPNDGYLTLNGGNLLINPQSAGKSIRFLVGGSANSDQVATMSNTRFAVNATTISTGSTTGALVVAGGVGVAGTLNVQTAANLGNVTFNNLTISSNVTNTGLTINPNGTGTTTFNSGLNNSRTVINGTRANTLVVSGAQVGANVDTFVSGAGFQVGSNDSMLLPVGPIGTRPGSPVAGMFRFSTSTNNIEWYDGTAWQTASTNFTVVTANTQTGNGVATLFTLPVANASTAGTIVSINGVVQEPINAYSITGANVTFTEAPSSTDVIDFRVFTTTSQVTAVTDIAGTTGLFLDQPAANSKIITLRTFGNESFSIQANSTARFTGNVEPSANLTYSLGSSTNRWKDAWIGGTTLYIGNIAIKETAANTVGFFALNGTTPASISSSLSDPDGIQSTVIGNATPAFGKFTVLEVTTGIAPTANATVNIGNVANQFNTIFAKATSAQYADLAENYLGDVYYEPGTVVEFGGDYEVTVCTTEMSPRIAGVVSTNPAYLMNSGLTGIATPVALQGRVPCKVVGPVRKGDMMVSAGNGAAQAVTAPVIGSVIGKSLENFDGVEGVIEVVVGRV